MESPQRILLNRWFLGMLTIGGMAALSSFIIAGVLDLKPCMMCRLQRIPFILLVVNAGFGLLSSYKQGFFKVTQGYLCLGIVLGVFRANIAFNYLGSSN